MDFRTYSQPRAVFYDKRLVLARCFEARTFLSKLKGLIGAAAIQEDEGLWIPHCASIHTFFMRFPIDVCFLNSEGVVIRAISTLRPCRVTGYVWRATGVIEASAGWIARSGIQKGARLVFDGGT